MFRNISGPILSTLLAISLVPLPLHAEIYKWKDASGKIHYSDNKVEADKAQAEVLAVRPAATHAGAPAPAWQQQEADFKRRQAIKPFQPPQFRDRPQSSGALVPGDHPETDTSRCALARGIQNGSLVHGNGKPTDLNDREIAARDIRTYCH